MDAFNPNSDPLAYRRTLSRFVTGITVVTTMGPMGPIAITANSFTSVSIAPPLILWCPDKKSKRHDTFTEAKHSIVHVLSGDQRNICETFARSASAFSDIDWERNTEGAPLIKGCLARFECEAYTAHDAGDHTVLIAKVLRAHQKPLGDALVFANGRYTVLDNLAL